MEVRRNDGYASRPFPNLRGWTECGKRPIVNTDCSTSATRTSASSDPAGWRHFLECRGWGTTTAYTWRLPSTKAANWSPPIPGS
jgi:hypothetical protein